MRIELFIILMNEQQHECCYQIATNSINFRAVQGFVAHHMTSFSSRGIANKYVDLIVELTCSVELAIIIN